MADRWIAEQRVVFDEDSVRTPGRILVGDPEEDVSNWVCEVGLEGLERTFRICGDGSLQALLLGVQFLGYQVHGFRSRGGRVLTPEGEEFPLEAFFGPLLRAPPTGR
jgi:hypothetical protein